jgi:hypothetical protein
MARLGCSRGGGWHGGGSGSKPRRRRQLGRLPEEGEEGAGRVGLNGRVGRMETRPGEEGRQLSLG